jgi:hypothetical protein
MKVKLLILMSLSFFGCKNTETNAQVPENKISSESRNYWYNGQAEISSYALSQARYGELRQGTAVLLYVTETFSEKSFTKADNPSNNDIPVLKLNFMKNFKTGIYPYSVMTSTFLPMKGGNSLKATSSMQEWCGHIFFELKNTADYEVSLHSYFEGESFEDLKVKKVLLEDDVWTMIRLNPENLPTGKMNVIPAFSIMRFLHKEFKAYECQLDKKIATETTVYTLNYPDLKRNLSITFESKFPHKVLSWEESYPDGFSKNPKILTSTGKLIKTIKSDYWNKNSNNDSVWRKELGLE